MVGVLGLVGFVDYFITPISSPVTTGVRPGGVPGSSMVGSPG